MSMVADALAALQRTLVWKKLKDLPATMDALEERIATIRIEPKTPISACPSCGARAYSLVSPSATDRHVHDLREGDRTYKCEACGFSGTTPASS
jgi:hypothetical protein